MEVKQAEGLIVKTLLVLVAIVVLLYAACRSYQETIRGYSIQQEPSSNKEALERQKILQEK